MAKLNMGIIGCGDFLRWQANGIKKSSLVRVRSLFDPDAGRSKKYAALLGGSPVGSADEIFADKSVDIICLFVPPWLRKNMVIQAVKCGKHILATKPLGPNIADCAAMVKAVGKKVRAGIIYRRTGSALFETYKRIFKSGQIGRLALYRQDWLHHYPQWNNWATDPARNGGPFMDAMIHNLNIARYLMGRPATACTYSSAKLAHRELKCGDTEFMKLDFAGGSAHLFITWAADLAVHSTQGNDREHIDICYMVTDKGWRLTDCWQDDKQVVIASRLGKKKVWPVKPLGGTVFDRFAAAILKKGPQPSDLPDMVEAAQDVTIYRQAERQLGKIHKVKLPR
ncbi:MAG: Gfo/Idh/MocA family oxidoreductase [Planctomycetes bacterium]|nr:Gfo/Idh/MocA family oxidoreductase [Planctomycetota bacterium]